MSEIALVSARKSKLETEAKKGNKKAAVALKLACEPDRFFSTVQIGITLVGILTGLYSGEAFATDLAVVIGKISFLAPYSLIISKTIIVIIVTYLTLVLGELVPKRLGMKKAERIAKSVAKPMFFISKITLPIIWFLSKSTAFILNILGINKMDDNKVTEDEIKAIVREGLDDGEIDEVEQEIVERVFTLGDRNVSSIMTHRSELVILNSEESNDEIKKKVMANIHNVYPVVSGDMDNLLGVVYLKDMFGQVDSPDFSLKNIIKPAQFLPEIQSVYSVLELFKSAHMRFGIIIDEFGNVQGAITMSDIMEALIGEVQDLSKQSEIVERKDGSFLIDGQCSFYNFLEYFDREYLYPDNSYNTLSGLILDELEHIPAEGEKVYWADFELEIVDMDGARIDKVIVIPPKE